MKLPKNLISEFVKVTNNVTKTKTETTVYGSIIKNGDSTYVKIDGSDILTPVTTTADTQQGERVTVLIKNHTATVTGNITSPAARIDDVLQLGADKLDASSAEIIYATVASLNATNAKINNLEATHGSFETLTTEKFEAVDAKINNISRLIEEGNSENWSYRKFSNGDVKLWGSYTVSDVPCSTSFGSSMYRSDALTMPAFPFSVYDPNLTASYESNGYGAMLWAIATTTETSPPSYYLIGIDSSTIVSGKINFHVNGKWST